MFINPQTAIDNGWVTFPDWMSDQQRQKCVQPNALDFTIDSLFRVNSNDPAVITEDVRRMRGVVPCELDENGLWSIEPNVLYDGMSDFYVAVPHNTAAMLVVRSSFNRVGIQLVSGLYDDSFKGNIGYTLFNRCGLVKTAPTTRIGQLIFVEAPSSGRYAGGYNTSNGQHWLDIAKTV